MTRCPFNGQDAMWVTWLHIVTFLKIDTILEYSRIFSALGVRLATQITITFILDVIPASPLIIFVVLPACDHLQTFYRSSSSESMRDSNADNDFPVPILVTSIMAEYTLLPSTRMFHFKYGTCVTQWCGLGVKEI
ncbi:hypothetical protein Plhal304r1_c035g0108061 [Plasmopara halstedii]